MNGPKVSAKHRRHFLDRFQAKCGLFARSQIKMSKFWYKKAKKRIRMTFCELLLQPILGVVGRKYVNFSLLVEFFGTFDAEKPVTQI